jgi:hypothetical protein
VEKESPISALTVGSILEGPFWDARELNNLGDLGETVTRKGYTSTACNVVVDHQCAALALCHWEGVGLQEPLEAFEGSLKPTKPGSAEIGEGTRQEK